MKRTEKEKIVGDLHQKLERARAVFLNDFTGLNVESLNKLRRELTRGETNFR